MCVVHWDSNSAIPTPHFARTSEQRKQHSLIACTQYAATISGSDGAPALSRAAERSRRRSIISALQSAL